MKNLFIYRKKELIRLNKLLVKRLGIEKYSPLKLKTNIKQNKFEEKE